MVQRPEAPSAFVDDPVSASSRPRVDADDLHADTVGIASDGSGRATSDIGTGSPVTVACLAGLVSGTRPMTLFEPPDTGFWMWVHVDTACDLEQQYHP